MHAKEKIKELKKQWKQKSRWKGIERPYSAEQVVKMQGTYPVDCTLGKSGAEKLWELFHKESCISALGAMTGNQAVEQAAAGLKSVYVSGWQVAADSNDALQTYPDQSLYPCMSVPHLVRRIHNALRRADQIQHMEGRTDVDYFLPIIADAEAGFGGPLNTFELIKAMIESGAAAVHLEDQLSSLKKCGHLGGRVLVPAELFTEKLVVARFAADLLGASTLIIARTDAEGASYIRSDSDPADQPFLTGKRSSEGYFCVKSGVEFAVSRARIFAPYSDMVWCETSKPDLGAAKEFAQGVHEKFPGKWLAYNCSPSFNWKQNLDDKTLARFQEKLADMGYKFQFITLAGFHTLNAGMFALANAFKKEGMSAYAKFQQEEFNLESKYGYQALKHQSFVGVGYFDEILNIVTQGKASTQALTGSTEALQFTKKTASPAKKSGKKGRK